MPAIFFQQTLPFNELAALSQEFPLYEFLTDCENPNLWASVEILFGNQLTEEQFSLSTRLKWIHSPNTDTEGLCLNEIVKRGDTLITLSKGQDVPQIAEFVVGGILAFAKQFFLWPKVTHDPEEFWNWPLKETVWTIQKKILLQIGLGNVGSAIAKLAASLGMHIWGVRQHQSFHPYCKKTFSLANLHSLLPAADVVVVALPKSGIPERLFGKDEFKLMKPDSIFIVVGSGDSVNEEALGEVAKTGKFRGILLDAFRKPSPTKKSLLWEIPNVILTPSIATLPHSEQHISFRLFRENLRLFVPGKINEMKNRIL